jgi:uncharacterized membrane protein YcfT
VSSHVLDEPRPQPGSALRTPGPGTAAPSAEAAGSSRQAWADVAKGACILLVVLHHLVHKQLDFVVPLGHEQWQDAWATATWALKPIRMPLFFLVSGFFAAGALQRPWADVRRRVLTPAWLYAVWLLVLSGFYLVETATPAHRVTTLEELARQVVLPATSMWFLYAMTAYFLLARLLRGLPPGPVLAVAAALSASVSWWGLEGNNEIAFLSHFVYFAAGAWFPAHVRRVAAAGLSLRALGLAYGAATTVVILAPMPLSASVLLLALLGVPLGIAVAERLSSTAAAGPLAWLGRRTLQVYVLHLIVIGVLAHVPMRIGPEPGPFEVLAFAAYPLVATVAVTGACLLAHRALLESGMRWLFRAPGWLTGH